MEQNLKVCWSEGTIWMCAGEGEWGDRGAWGKDPCRWVLGYNDMKMGVMERAENGVEWGPNKSENGKEGRERFSFNRKGEFRGER